MFLQMRAKSVGESAEILIKCEECGADNPISINLEEIKVDVKNVDKKVQLTDDIALELNYPSYLDMINSGIGDGDLNADQMFEVMHSCVKYIETPDERIDIKDVDKKEVVEFIESMNSKQFEKIQEFISDIPRLSHTVKFDCKSCEHKNEITVEGISNFL
jgi:hypothetical protein